MNSAPEICFDKILPASMLRMHPSRAPGPLEAIMPVGKAWPNGNTLRVLFLEGTQAQRRLAMDQAQWWTQHANLRFVESTDKDAEIRVTFDPADGAWSYVGTDCGHIPQGQPTMNLGFQTGGTSAHEFGHAIGLAHEHQSPHGGLQWNEAEVIKDLSGRPNFWTEAQIRHNVLNKYARDQVNGTQFDGASIMLYAFPARWTTNGVGTNANEVLSSVDKAFVADVYRKGGDLTVTRDSREFSRSTVRFVRHDDAEPSAGRASGHA